MAEVGQAGQMQALGQSGTGRSRSRGRPRSRAIDERILSATLAILGRDGYARMSIDAVAAEAGVTRPTVYLRHATKAELATAALAAFRGRAKPRDTGDTRADLVARLNHFRAGVERPNGMATLGTVLAEENHTPELLALWRERLVAPRRHELRAILRRARDRGELRPDADLDAAVAMLVGSYFAFYVERGRVPRSWPEAEVDLVLGALAAAPKREPADAR
jgi:AcrR family transcriptional regulator